MHKPLDLLVFSDLDGTLLDHHSYDWSPAKPALEALKKAGAGLILASSKTAVEIAGLRADLQMQDWPAIVENGAGLLAAHEVNTDDCTQYQQLRARLQQLPDDLKMHFTGFGDLSNQQVAEITGLTESNATLAKQRAYSEPGLWQGSDKDKKRFIELLDKDNITAQQGGRFLTLSFGTNKADQLRLLAAHYQPQITIALGDAPNDIEMLEAADIGVIVSNPQSSPLPMLAGESEGRIIRTINSGPVGWNATILDLLARPQLNISENL